MRRIVEAITLDSKTDILLAIPDQEIDMEERFQLAKHLRDLVEGQGPRCVDAMPYPMSFVVIRKPKTVIYDTPLRSLFDQ